MMAAEQKLLDAARVALAALQGRVSPTVAEHALEEAIAEAEAERFAATLGVAVEVLEGKHE